MFQITQELAGVGTGPCQGITRNSHVKASYDKLD